MEQPVNFPPAMPPVRRKGAGCLVQVLGALALGVMVLYAIYAVFAPWAFYMGGRFHLYPGWTGWGRMHSNIAGDYVLYVTISPSTGGRGGRSGGGPHVRGNAVLCTPRGEKYKLRVGGDFQRNTGIDLQGKTASLYANNYLVFSGSTDPSLEFRGKWNNPDLLLDDQGSINRAFDPGGKLVTNHHMRPYKQEVVPLTLHEGARADFEAVCALIAKH